MNHVSPAIYPIIKQYAETSAGRRRLRAMMLHPLHLRVDTPGFAIDDTGMKVQIVKAALPYEKDSHELLPEGDFWAVVRGYAADLGVSLADAFLELNALQVDLALDPPHPLVRRKVLD